MMEKFCYLLPILCTVWSIGVNAQPNIVFIMNDDLGKNKQIIIVLRKTSAMCLYNNKWLSARVLGLCEIDRGY